MFCDSSLATPMRIDIDSLRHQRNPVYIKEEPDKKRTELKVQTDYNVLPMFHLDNDELKYNLSIRHNEYLKCRWNKYVAEGRKGFPKVQMYADVVQERIKAAHQNHRFRLSGSHYDANNRPAPVPHSPNIRDYYYKLKHGRVAHKA